MRKKIFGLVLILCFGGLLAGGCAKKEVVRSEEPVSPSQIAPPSVPPSVSPAPVEPTQPQVQPSTETPKETTVTPETPKEDTTQPAASRLQNELQKIYFNFDSAALSDEARHALQKDAELISKNNLKIRIEGNCDERGADDYNMALGERRAKAARDYLVNLGVPGDHLSTISYGEEKPAEPGHDEASWAKNRRDEFVIVK
jgi:peptidoglycan-associated lipoprotein